MSISDLEETLHSSIAEAVRAEYPGSIVTHWTAAVTVVTDEGTELVLTLDRPDQALWQGMGLLDFVREMRRAIISHQVSEQEE